jgi:hypothetical protein
LSKYPDFEIIRQAGKHWFDVWIMLSQ